MEKTVKVDEREWRQLNQDKLDRGLDKISDVIKENITFAKRFSNEKDFCKWFERNYKLFGFTKIIKKQGNRTPDYIMEYDKKELKVEIETLSSHFINHKHNPKDVDLVICLINNRKLPVKTIEVGNFDFIGKEMFTKIISVSNKFIEKLKTYGKFGDSYEDILIRIIEKNGYPIKKEIEELRRKQLLDKKDVDSFKTKKKRGGK